MEACLPDEKLQRICTMVAAWLSEKKATKREIMSLVDLLQHAIRVVIPGRMFVSRMYIATACLKKLSHFT